MKHLKSYKLFESRIEDLEDDVKDILLELEDEGFQIEISRISKDVEIDTEISIFDKEGGKGNRYKIKEIYEDHFVIDEDIDGDECFVFGYEVCDLNGLDKSYIYTLNVCATQELHRRMEAQDKRIKELETKITQILTYISL